MSDFEEPKSILKSEIVTESSQLAITTPWMTLTILFHFEIHVAWQDWALRPGIVSSAYCNWPDND